jgi:hypothetical protein
MPATTNQQSFQTSTGGVGTEPSSPGTVVALETANMLPAAQKANDSFVLFDRALFAGDYMLWGNGACW